MRRQPVYQTPIPPKEARRIMDENDVSQTDLAKEFKYDTSTVSKCINGRGESQPFWDKFFDKFNIPKAS